MARIIVHSVIVFHIHRRVVTMSSPLPLPPSPLYPHYHLYRAESSHPISVAQHTTQPTVNSNEMHATSTRLNAGHRRARTARADGRSDGRGEGTNDRTNDRTNAALGIIADSHQHGQAATIVEQQRRTNAATKRSDQTNARTHAQTNEQQQHNDNKGRKERTAEQRKP